MNDNNTLSPNNSNITKLIPNGITMLALCSGLTSIRYSILEQWKLAALLIIIAAVLDFFDGWIAKKLMGGSRFGAELDNLSDINMPISEHARNYLIAEGIRPETIIKTGSPMMEILNVNFL